MSDSSQQVYLNGRIVDAASAQVSAFDSALLHGVGLFETLRSYDGVIFRLHQHIERLRNSVDALKLPLVIDEAVCREALEEVLEANGLQDARLRLTVTAGPTQLPGSDEPDHTPTILATATAIAAYPRELYEKGMTVAVSRYRQSAADPLAGHKSTAYWPRLIALREAQQAGCGEAVWFTPTNLLAEGSISNVFVVKNGVIKTPPVDTPVLPGIVRSVILEAAYAEGRKAEEIPLTINDLLDADEVFLTNSIMEIMPVCRVERKPVGDEKPGEMTKWAANAYRKAVSREKL